VLHGRAGNAMQPMEDLYQNRWIFLKELCPMDSPCWRQIKCAKKETAERNCCVVTVTNTPTFTAHG